MDSLGSALEGFFTLFFIVFIVAIIGIIYGAYSFYTQTWGTIEIVSAQIIQPELKLTIKNNKVDTLYVYKLKK